LLGLNKQLDLQTLLTELARDLAHAQGWYDNRRRYQVAFVVGLFVAGCVAAAWLLRFFWPVLRRVRLALAGLCLIAVYVFLRAALFQRVALLRSSELAEAAWLLEVLGIALVSAAAWRAQPRT
jgi:ABC-type branched-subunit amino acid transport system permease subunit